MVGTKYGQVVAEFVTRMLHEERFTLIGDGSQTRSFCYVKDAIWIIKQLMEKISRVWSMWVALQKSVF